MASKDDDVHCTLTWKIENISYCLQQKMGIIWSPLFLAEALENTMWKLGLYLRGVKNGNCIGIYLRREDSAKPKRVEIDCELAFLAPGGSVLARYKKINRTFKKLNCRDFVKQEYAFFVDRTVYMPQDSLTACCRIWKTKEKTMQINEIFARTIIPIVRRSFACRIEKFSSLEPDNIKKIFMKSAAGDDFLEFELLFIGESICIDIKSSHKDIMKFQVFLVDIKGSRVNCGQEEFLFDEYEKDRDLTLLLTREQLIKNKTSYLPNDVLTLNLECCYSAHETIEFIDRISLWDIPPHNKNEVEEDINNYAEGMQSDTLMGSLEFLYRKDILCDTKLCTKTETFPVHSLVLSARSPVFRAMFSTDMKEKAKDSVDIYDVDADTMRQMLQYMYTDTLENSDWENASLLYAAADKYEIVSLRNKCSSYLKSSFDSTNVCQILALSNMHQDNDLKKAVQDYILKHSEVVFQSNEWILFMETNLKLAAETMHQNWNKNKVPTM